MFVINNDIQSYIDSMTEEIKSKAPYSSGKLKQSITDDVKITDKGFIVSFTMVDYGYYQDKGVNGTKKSWGAPYSFSKMPPPSKLDGWVVSNGIAPRTSGGQFTSRKGIDFVIARSIMENGIKPKNFTQPVIDKKIEGLADLVAEQIWDDFQKKINNI